MEKQKKSRIRTKKKLIDCDGNELPCDDGKIYKEFGKDTSSAKEINYLLLYYKEIDDINLRIKVFDFVKYISTCFKE